MTQPLQDHPRLIGIRTKTARAHQHGQTLHTLIRTFINAHPQRVSKQYRSVPGEHVWKLMSEPPEIPSEVNALIGDILYNCRSALDHAVWQLVVANGEVPSESNQFPIFDNAREYKQRRQRYLHGVSEEAIAEIDRLQPCNGGNESLSHLNALGNIDKHRHLPFIFVNLEQIDLADTPIPLRANDSITMTMNIGRLERGTEFLTVPLPQEMEVDFKPIFGVAFGEGTPVNGTNVMDVFRAIWVAVVHSIRDLAPHITRS